jgi:hypothetical protein
MAIKNKLTLYSFFKYTAPEERRLGQKIWNTIKKDPLNQIFGWADDHRLISRDWNFITVY